LAGGTGIPAAGGGVEEPFVEPVPEPEEPVPEPVAGSVAGVDPVLEEPAGVEVEEEPAGVEGEAAAPA